MNQHTIIGDDRPGDASHLRPRFMVGQEVHSRGFTCGCYHQHGERVSFRRYDIGDMAEVFTCRGSATVYLSRLVETV